MRFTAGFLLLATTAAARGDTPTAPGINDVVLQYSPTLDIAATPGPQFAFVGAKAFVAAKKIGDIDTMPIDQMAQREVVAISADKQTAWSAADLADFEIGCGAAPCPPPPPPPLAIHHAVMLWQRAGNDWSYVAWHIAPVVDAKAQAAALKAGTLPPSLGRELRGAEAAVKVFESTIGDAKAFANTVSDRKDVVLYGSERAERTVGGASVRSKLIAWNLVLKLRDGVQAGVTTSKTVAWIAANVDASSPKKPKDKPQPYRVFAIYEKSGDAWKLVHASFSVAID